MTQDLDAVLASIDGALADEAMPDGMRWSPAPEKVTDAAVNLYDGECVPIPPQRHEQIGGFPVIPARLPTDRPRLAPYLLVEEHGPGTVTVRRAAPEDIAHLFEGFVAAAVEAFRPLAALVIDATRAFSEAGVRLADDPPAAWRAAATEEQRRDAALAHRRALGSGPARPGPEQSHAPRRLAR
jgi:hypothetical protein